MEDLLVASAPRRWVRFNAVGVLGYLVQATTLAALVRWTGLPPSLALSLAVLTAVSHNFAWHERYTWQGLPRSERRQRWLSFHLSTGLVSVVSNLALTTLVMKTTGLSLVVSNVIAVTAASAVNFAVNDRLVFRE